MLKGDALHLHEPSGLQLCIWMVLWISYAGLTVFITIYTIFIIIIVLKGEEKPSIIFLLLPKDWTDLAEGWLYGEWETGRFLSLIRTLCLI